MAATECACLASWSATTPASCQNLGGCPAEPGAHEAAAVAVAAARAGRATHAAWISPPGESRAVDMPTGDVLIFEDDGGEAPAGAPRR